MNLTKEIKNRKIGFEPKVKVSNNRIEIEKIGIGIELSDKFTVADKSEFRNFISDYEFPKNLELNKKDREEFEKELFEPIFTLSDKENNRPIIPVNTIIFATDKTNIRLVINLFLLTPKASRSNIFFLNNCVG